ncbi:MAG: recombination mediator RecR [Leptospiraceae bacterium]|nr:recombination mediator RecR [Leptospiraceae bacterium]
MTEDLLKKLVNTLSSLPGIGKKSAYRIGFHLIRMEETRFQQLIENLKEIKENIKFCKTCGSITDREVCDICLSETRSNEFLCVVEMPEDIFFIENTGEFKGKYHVLGGVISPIDGIGPDKLKISELLERLKSSSIKELLIATNPTLEGDATASYIANLLKDTDIRFTRIAHGVTIGSTLEFADQYTLGRAIRGRQKL